MKWFYTIIFILLHACLFAQESRRQTHREAYFNYNSLPIVIDRDTDFLSGNSANSLFYSYNYDKQFDNDFKDRITLNDPDLFKINGVKKLSVRDRYDRLIYELYFDISGRKSLEITYSNNGIKPTRKEVYKHYASGKLVSDSINYLVNDQLLKVESVHYIPQSEHINDTLISYTHKEIKVFKLGSYINKRNSVYNEYRQREEGKNARVLLESDSLGSELKLLKEDYAGDSLYLSGIKNEISDYNLILKNSGEEIPLSQLSHNTLSSIYTPSLYTALTDGEDVTIFYTNEARNWCGTSAMQLSDLREAMKESRFEVENNDNGLPVSYIWANTQKKQQLYTISYEF